MVGISVAVLPPLMSQAQELWVRLPSLINHAQQFLVEIGLLDQELTFRQAVEQAPTIPPDAIGTVFTAVWSVVGGVFGIITILVRFSSFRCFWNTIMDAQRLCRN